MTITIKQIKTETTIIPENQLEGTLKELFRDHCRIVAVDSISKNRYVVTFTYEVKK